MKRIICLIMALVLCLALFACGTKKVEGPNSAAPPGDASVFSGTVGNTDGTVAEGFFDPDYDYSANEAYKVCFLVDMDHSVYLMYDDVIAHWCSVMNIEYDGMVYPEDGDFLAKLEEVVSEYDGVIFYSLGNYVAAAVEILNASSCQWMSIYEIRDTQQENSPLMHPYVGFAAEDYGVAVAEYMVSYVENYMSGVSYKDIGIMYVTYSGYEVFDSRQQDFLDTVKELSPKLADNCVGVDLNTTTDNYDALYDTPISENPQYTHWLCFPLANNYVVEASDAFVRNELSDNAHIFAFTDPYETWLEYDYVLVDAVYTMPLVLQLEPVVGALYAFMNGDASPETLWSDSVAEGESYGQRKLDYYSWVTQDNCGDYIGKVNTYVGGEYYTLSDLSE